MNLKVLHQLFEIWETPQIDLFTFLSNHHPPMFCSLDMDPAVIHHDALNMTWMGWEICILPVLLLTKVLHNIRTEKADVILIALRWPRRFWFSELLHLSRSFASSS